MLIGSACACALVRWGNRLPMGAVPVLQLQEVVTEPPVMTTRGGVPRVRPRGRCGCLPDVDHGRASGLGWVGPWPGGQLEQATEQPGELGQTSLLPQNPMQTS